jgi:hypothetical protein
MMFLLLTFETVEATIRNTPDEPSGRPRANGLNALPASGLRQRGSVRISLTRAAGLACPVPGFGDVDSTREAAGSRRAKMDPRSLRSSQ